MKDPYQTLSVSRSAGIDEIKSAYRKLAKELHPDVNPGDTIVEQRFKEVSAAYNLLSNTEKRAQYDRGEINADGSPRYDNMFRGGGRAGARGQEFEDIFADLFGHRRQSTRVKGQDITYSVRITFVEAALGSKRRVELQEGKKFDVDLPSGSVDGDSVRLKGQGMPGSGGGPAGDAFIKINVDSHPFFERDGLDIHVDVPITLSEAVLGGKINVPTIHGAVALTIPEGSNTGRSLRLKGKGVTKGKGTAARTGDQYVRLKVVLPDKPDKKLKDFVKDWTSHGDYDVRKKLGLE